MYSRPLKIGYLMQSEAPDLSRPSGPQAHVEAVIKGLQKRGHQVRIVAEQRGRFVFSDDLVHWSPVAYSFSQTRRWRTVERAVRGLQSRLQMPYFRLFDSYKFADACYLALDGYDIFYERYGAICYGGALAARWMGIPLVLELNGDTLVEYKELGMPLSRVQWAIVRLILTYQYRHASCIIAVNNVLAQSTIRHYNVNPANVKVVTNGVNVDLFRNVSYSKAVLSRYNIPPGPVIAFVGSFQPWHGVDLLIDAFKIVASLNATATLVLIGDGELRSAMSEKAHSLQIAGRVVFTGALPQHELASILGAVDIAVLSNLPSGAGIHGMPLKLLEYMAAGKAIVATRLPNIEGVIVDRKTGLLVPPNDAPQMAGALLSLLEQEGLRIALGQAAQREALMKHSWDRAVSEIESILLNLTAK